jgi:hypothetical protein
MTTSALADRDKPCPTVRSLPPAVSGDAVLAAVAGRKSTPFHGADRADALQETSPMVAADGTEAVPPPLRLRLSLPACNGGNISKLGHSNIQHTTKYAALSPNRFANYY